MTTVVIGGHSRNVGKTSVMAGLIYAFRKHSWTAIKISSHWHAGSHPSEDEGKGRIYSIHEETSREGHSDTSRFLAAGASRSLWVRVRKNGLAAAMDQLRPILQSSPFVIIESNSILGFIKPDIYIVVLRYDVEDFKDSARETLKQAHAVVALNCSPSTPSWKGMAAETLSRIPIFTTNDLLVIPKDLIEWVGARLI